MNGAPGGPRQTRAGSSTQSGAVPSSSTRTSTTQASTSAPFYQPVESAERFITPTITSGAGLQPSGTLPRDISGSFSVLQSSSTPQGSSWSSQYELQGLYPSQIHSAQAATLQFAHPSGVQVPPLPEIMMATSPHHPPSLPSPATPSASGLTGLSSSSSALLAASQATSPALQFLVSSINPALLTQYQILLAAAAQQQAASAAAALAAASAGQQSSLGSRVCSSPISPLPIEQNLQRYLMQLQQQHHMGSTATPGTSYFLPTSPLHSTSTTLSSHSQMQTSSSLLHFPSSHVVQSRSVPSLSSVINIPPSGIEQQLPSVVHGTRTLIESISTAQSSPLVSTLPRQGQASLITTAPIFGITAATPTPSTSRMHLRHGQNQYTLMPPPRLPTSRVVPVVSTSVGHPRQRSPLITTQRPSSSAEPTFHTGNLPSQPYYPSHFMRGTVIRLQSGQFKRVEDMSTEDFVLSAAMKTDLILCSSKVIKIQYVGRDQHVLITFTVGEQNFQVTVQAAVEHPYFVVGQGWASCSPEKTRMTYGLICKHLVMGDVCFAIHHTEKGEVAPETTSGAGRPTFTGDVSYSTPRHRHRRIRSRSNRRRSSSASLGQRDLSSFIQSALQPARKRRRSAS